jgi:hypothetical protein
MEERGQLITLLCLQHQNGALTIKAVQLACPGVTHDVLAKFEVNEEGKYENREWKEVSKKRAAYSESRRNNRTKKEDKENIEKDKKNISSTYVKHMENVIEIENVIENKEDKFSEKFLKSNNPEEILDINIHQSSGADIYLLEVNSKNNGIEYIEIKNVWVAFCNKIRAGDAVFDRKQIWSRYATFCSWYKKYNVSQKQTGNRDKLLDLINQ